MSVLSKLVSIVVDESLSTDFEPLNGDFALFMSSIRNFSATLLCFLSNWKSTGHSSTALQSWSWEVHFLQYYVKNYVPEHIHLKMLTRPWAVVAKLQRIYLSSIRPSKYANKLTNDGVCMRRSFFNSASTSTDKTVLAVANVLTRFRVFASDTNTRSLNLHAYTHIRIYLSPASSFWISLYVALKSKLFWKANVVASIIITEGCIPHSSQQKPLLKSMSISSRNAYHATR